MDGSKLAGLKIGDFVKIRNSGQRFWCILTGQHDDGSWQAKVNNNTGIPSYDHGDEVRIKESEMLEYMEGRADNEI